MHVAVVAQLLYNLATAVAIAGRVLQLMLPYEAAVAVLLFGALLNPVAVVISNQKTTSAALMGYAALIVSRVLMFPQMFFLSNVTLFFCAVMFLLLNVLDRPLPARVMFIVANIFTLLTIVTRYMFFLELDDLSSPLIACFVVVNSMRVVGNFMCLVYTMRSGKL
mgnify:CR=1 FL=1